MMSCVITLMRFRSNFLILIFFFSFIHYAANYKWTLDCFSVCHSSLEYFLSLQSDSHREAWSNIIILLITRLLKMSDERVNMLIIHIFQDIHCRITSRVFTIHIELFLIGDMNMPDFISFTNV